MKTNIELRLKMIGSGAPDNMRVAIATPDGEIVTVKRKLEIVECEQYEEDGVIYSQHLVIKSTGVIIGILPEARKSNKENENNG